MMMSASHHCGNYLTNQFRTMLTMKIDYHMQHHDVRWWMAANILVIIKLQGAAK